MGGVCAYASFGTWNYRSIKGDIEGDAGVRGHPGGGVGGQRAAQHLLHSAAGKVRVP